MRGHSGRPGPADQICVQMVDDLLAGSPAVPGRIGEVAADLRRAEPLPAHAEWCEVPVLIRTGDAARRVVAAPVACGASHRRCPVTVRAAADVDDVAMLIVTLARGVDLGV